MRGHKNELTARKGEVGGKHQRAWGGFAPLTTHPSVVSACLLLTNRTYCISLSPSLSLSLWFWCCGRQDKVVTESSVAGFKSRYKKASRWGYEAVPPLGAIRHISWQGRHT